MRFVKMHGLSNDFVVVDEPFDLSPEQIAVVCDRRMGIGADGLLAVGLDGGVVTMRYWNHDGSLAEMCGNGLRCVARYAVDEGLMDRPRFVVRTPVGERRVEVGVDEVTVELGPVETGDPIEIDGRTFTRVGVGNPHVVTEVDDPDAAPVTTLGAQIERHPAFPHGTNVEFATFPSPGVAHMRVWERGVGETMACGTGMVAVATVARIRSGADTVEVHVPGGVGWVDFEGGVAWLRGPAVTVFAGTVDVGSLSAPV